MKENEVRLYSGTGDELAAHTLNGKKGIVYPVSEGTIWSHVPLFSPDGRYLVVNNAVGEVSFLDATTLSLVHALPREPGSMWIESLRFTPQGKLIAGSSDGYVGIWNLEDFSLEKLFKLD